jgi:hypothetical protein
MAWAQLWLAEGPARKMAGRRGSACCRSIDTGDGSGRCRTKFATAMPHPRSWATASAPAVDRSARGRWTSYQATTLPGREPARSKRLRRPSSYSSAAPRPEAGCDGQTQRARVGVADDQGKQREGKCGLWRVNGNGWACRCSLEHPQPVVGQQAAAVMPDECWGAEWQRCWACWGLSRVIPRPPDVPDVPCTLSPALRPPH